MSVAVSEKLDLDTINPMLESSDAPKIVEWSVAQFGDEVVMSSSFGEQAAVMLHLATRVKPDIKIIFVDTGYLFPETFQFMEQLRQRFNLNVWTYRTKHDPIAWLHQAGEENPNWRKDVDSCCNANKNEPFNRAFQQLKPRAWLRGARREQTPERKNFKFIEWDKRYKAYAVSPILNWTSPDVGRYMKQHDLPYHPLVEKGYPSIGCNPLSCTRNVLPVRIHGRAVGPEVERPNAASISEIRWIRRIYNDVYGLFACLLKGSLSMKRAFGWCALAAMILGWNTGCSTAPKSSGERQALIDQSNASLKQMRAADSSLDRFFPRVGICDFSKRGQGRVHWWRVVWARGVVFEKGSPLGFSDLTQLTVGLQAGGQSFSELIVFETRTDLNRFTAGKLAFAANISAVALKTGAADTARYTGGVAVFVQPIGGLMFEAALGGQQFTFVPR